MNRKSDAGCSQNKVGVADFIRNSEHFFARESNYSDWYIEDIYILKNYTVDDFDIRFYILDPDNSCGPKILLRKSMVDESGVRRFWFVYHDELIAAFEDTNILEDMVLYLPELLEMVEAEPR